MPGYSKSIKFRTGIIAEKGQNAEHLYLCCWASGNLASDFHSNCSFTSNRAEVAAETNHRDRGTDCEERTYTLQKE
jgi:hypothetical protein